MSLDKLVTPLIASGHLFLMQQAKRAKLSLNRVAAQRIRGRRLCVSNLYWPWH